MKSNAECNETTPEIIVYRFDEYYEILTKMHQKLVCFNTNRQVRKETRTDMESATFEMMETTVAIFSAIALTSEINET